MNAREPSPSAQFSTLLSRFPSGIVALAKRCLLKLRRIFPGCYQLVYDYSNSLVVAFGVSDRGYEAIVALAIHPDRIQLYFDKSLPDPARRLKGAGTKVRSVTIETASDLDHGDIQALFKAAIEQAGGLPHAGIVRMIIKSGARNQKPKKGTRS